MKLFLLRHTTLDIDDDVFYGQTDVDVSRTFLKEVLLIKKKLKREKVDLKRVLIFSSSLKRCKKLASQLSKDFIIDSRLKELNLGDWEMKKMSSIPKKEIDKWHSDMLNYRVPNGERNKDFLNRLKKFLKDVLNLDQDMILVAHAGSINGIISILTNQSFDKLVKNYWEKIKHGSLSYLEIIDKKATLKFIGK